MNADLSLLVGALREPSTMSDLGLPAWDRLIPLARRANLLARLAWLVGHHRLQVPREVEPHLRSARYLAERQQRVILWEVEQIARALAPLECPVVLLKGAAYVMAGLEVAGGRLFGDVDILLPRERLDEAERLLRYEGWFSQHHDDYDQRYYRCWMHELPPLRHLRRGTVLDVHHNILPLTSPLCPDIGPLVDDSRPLPAAPGEVRVPSPVDMVIHSATHLFQEGEFDNAFRDLVDLHLLLEEFGADPGFHAALLERTERFGLWRPLYYALRYVHRMLETPIPDTVLEVLYREGRPRGRVAMMDALFGRALLPLYRVIDTPLSGVSRKLLYVRAHRLRMPWHLLIPHLARKAMRGREDAV